MDGGYLNEIRQKKRSFPLTLPYLFLFYFFSPYVLLFNLGRVSFDNLCMFEASTRHQEREFCLGFSLTKENSTKPQAPADDSCGPSRRNSHDTQVLQFSVRYLKIFL